MRIFVEIRVLKYQFQIEMMDPPSYCLTFFSMFAIVVFMKFMTKYGERIGVESETQEILCVPVQ